MIKLCVWLLHIANITANPQLSYIYDASGGIFNEISKDAPVIIIQDFKIIKSVISITGPSMTPALKFKDKTTCRNGGINYSNILSNFQQELQKLLFNAGIETTSTPKTSTPNTETPRITEGKRSVTYYSEQSLYNSYDDEYTVFFKNGTHKTTTLTSPKPNVVVSVTQQPETLFTKSPSTNTKHRTSTSSTKASLTSTSTSTTTTTTTTTPTTPTYKTTATPTSKTTTTSISTTTSTTTSSTIMSTEIQIRPTTRLSESTKVDELKWSPSYSTILEKFDENWSDSFRDATRRASFCEMGPLSGDFSIENNNFESIKLNSKTQACLKNSTRITELYRFRLNNTPESLIDSSIRLLIKYNTTKIQAAKLIESSLYMTLGFPKSIKLDTTTSLAIKRNVYISLIKQGRKIKTSNAALITYNIYNINYEHNYLNITKLVITVKIEIQRNYLTNDFIEIKVPLHEIENIYKAKISMIKNIFTLENSRNKRFAEIAAGAALGFLGDEIFSKIGNLFKDDNQEETEQKIVSLTEHLKRYESSSLNYNERMNEQLVEIHNEHLNENKALFDLICNEVKAQSEITVSYLRLSLSESLNQVDILSTSINDNTLRADHPIIRNLVLICSKLNTTVKNVRKMCQDIIKDMHLSTISTITYDKTTNQFLMHVNTELPIFKFLQNTTVTSYYFLRNIKYAPETATTRITKIKSDNFSIIRSPELPHDLIYHKLSYDTLGQVYIVRADENNSIMDETLLECTSKLSLNITCPIESYRSQTRCLTQKFTTLTKHQFVHFTSIDPLEVSAIGSTYHGVLYRSNSEADKTSKIFNRYSKTPVVIKCGLSKFNLGLDKRIPEVKIELKKLTTSPELLDEIDLLSIKQNEQTKDFNNNFLNLSQELSNLNNDASLLLGNKRIVDIKNLKWILVGLTMSFTITMTCILIRKFWIRIKLFWRQRYRTPPQPAPRAYNNIRLSNRNINRPNTATNN